MSTEVTIQQSSTRPLYRKFVRDGVAGNYDVVFEMIRLIREGVDYDKGVEAIAKRILITNKMDSFTPYNEQLQAVFNFVRDRVTYIQDIAGRIESLKSARQTLSDGYGDCDDNAVLNATLVGDLGFEDVRIAMARYSPNEDTFSHVYCVVYAGGKRYVMDTSLPDGELDQEVKPFEVKEIKIFENVQGLDGVSGIYNNARHHARRAARTATKMLPAALNTLPLGFLAGNALATGVNLMEGSKPSAYSLPSTGSSINAELDRIILDLLQSRIAYDLAKTQALQVAAQLAAVEVDSSDRYAFTVVAKSIKDKITFINNFKTYAEANNIRLVHLNPTLMMYAGIGLAGAASYFLYQHYVKGNRGFTYA